VSRYTRPALDRAEKAARLRRARGIPGYTPARTVATHIRRLQQAGWTQPEIAAASGIHRRTLFGITASEREQVLRTTATAILALRPADAPRWVPAHGTARRMQALAAIGWTVVQTGQEAGLTGSWCRDLVTGRRPRVTRETAAAVDAVFRARCMTPGPSHHARVVAARNGWPPPLAWDDIDDLSEEPQGIARRRKQAA
jgi:hypothetical protein